MKFKTIDSVYREAFIDAMRAAVELFNAQDFDVHPDFKHYADRLSFLAGALAGGSGVILSVEE